MNKDIEKIAKDISNKHGLPTYDPVQWHHIKNAMCEMYTSALQSSTLRPEVDEKINSIALCFMENINVNQGTSWSQMLRLVDEIKEALSLPVDKEGRDLDASDNYYPGSSYQRLFNAISDTKGTATQGEMDEIVRIVKEDFLTSDNTNLNTSCVTPLYSGKEIEPEAHIYKNRYEAMQEHLKSQVETIVQLRADNKTLRELLNNPTPFNSSKEQDKNQNQS